MRTGPVVDLEQRLAECRRRWEAAPGSRAFIPLADVLRQAGRCEEALAVLEQGLRAHPHAVGGLVTLARTHGAAGRPQQAAAVAARILDLDPDNLVALEMLGQEERRRGDIAGAIARYGRLAELEPADRHWGDVLTELRKEGETTAADETEPEAEAGFATLTLADLYLAQGYRQKAAATLRRLAAERPHDPEPAARLAELEAAAAPGSGAGAASRPQPPAPPASPPASPRAVAAPPAAERRQQSQEQFALWIERLRAERGAPR